MEPAKKVTNTHDLDFMLYCSFGQGYRLTGNKHYLDVIHEGTLSLLTRWNEHLGVIKSWDSNPRWQYPVIIDNMMNLEMLCFMTREFSDRRYEQIAEKHAQTTMKNHFRPDFHLDYYNSLVIHPMFTETLQILKKHHLAGADFLPIQTERHGRLAAQLERMISPEGSYPVTGRSIVYRFGSFHALADAAWLHILPKDVSPAQVRCALTAVIQRQLSQPLTFDSNGWLRIGYTGSQIRMSEDYINTGSLYLCTTAFLPLGLPADDPFWSAPARDWTSKKAWSGQNIVADHAIR